VSAKKTGEGELGELATYQKRRVMEKISGQLEASFLIFLTLGLIKQNNTHCRCALAAAIHSPRSLHSFHKLPFLDTQGLPPGPHPFLKRFLV